MLNIKMYQNELIGFEGTIIELSNKLVSLDCEDICEFGNWIELLEDKNMIVATDDWGDEHIQIYFEVITEAGEGEIIEATSIKITDVEEF